MSNRAEKSLKRLDKKILKRIDVALSDLEHNPLPFNKYDMDKVEGKKDTYRLRISSYRIVYEIFWIDKLISVKKIEKKGDETYK